MASDQSPADHPQATKLRPPSRSGDERERILVAMARTVNDRGVEMTTADLVAHRAAVSRQIFDAHFATIEDCLVASFDASMRRACARLVSAYRSPLVRESAGPSARLSLTLDVLIDLVADDPATARFCLLESRCGGRAARQHHDLAITYLARMLAGAITDAQSTEYLSLPVATAIVGGVWEVASQYLLADEPPERSIVADRLFRWLSTYTGPTSTQSVSALPEDIQHPRTTDDRLSIHHPTPRERLLAAIASVARISGYHAATVSAIAAQANLPEAAFHNHFRNKEDAFLCAYDHWVNQLATATTKSCNGADTSRGAMREILAFLGGLSTTQPDLCYLATAEIFALGATGHTRHAQTFSRFESQLRSAFGNQVHICDITSTAVMGSVSQAIAQAVTSGDNHDLTRQLEFLVLTPLEAAG